MVCQYRLRERNRRNAVGRRRNRRSKNRNVREGVQGRIPDLPSLYSTADWETFNQSEFRKRLIKRYGAKCCLCGVSDKRLLFASHIKAWKDSDLKEKIDVDNGFLLCPNHDHLFDKHLIAFDDEGKIMISSILSKNDRIFMNVKENMIVNLRDGNMKYLEFHRSKFNKKND